MAIAQYLSKARLPDPMYVLGRGLTAWGTSGGSDEPS
jgi:hypothetical protein